MGTELIPAKLKTAMANVEAVSRDYGLAAIENKGELERGLMLAEGTTQMMALLTEEVMKPIMALQGSTLGFRTDKDSAGGYPLKAVRDVTIEAYLRGFRMTGNEVNIIAGRFYAAKDGCRRRVLEWPGLKEFRHELSFPTDKGGTAYVNALATWTLNGKPDQYERRDKTAIPSRRNSGMGDDAILGKAERKLYAGVLNQLSSFVIPDGEVDADTVNATSQPADARRSSLNDYADETPAEPAKPTFDPEEQIGMVDGFRSNLEMATDNKAAADVQKEAATWARDGKLSPESLEAVNKLANQRRSAIRKGSSQLFDG